ncbi:MAG TPA: hypothetical protein VG963_15740, partial [Polyangiaceae bacterium]|nr:hypothetical protein [Polyangiaceae bacterium]
MTPPLIDVIARSPATAPAESVSPALPVSAALLMPGVLSSGSGIRFGDALRAQVADAATGVDTMAGSADAGACEVHIDDVDILCQLTGAGMNAAALRDRLGNVRDGSAELPDDSADSADVAPADAAMAFASAVAPSAHLAPVLAT